MLDGGPHTYTLINELIKYYLQGPLGDQPGSCQYNPNNRTIVIMIVSSSFSCVQTPASRHMLQCALCERHHHTALRTCMWLLIPDVTWLQ